MNRKISWTPWTLIKESCPENAAVYKIALLRSFEPLEPIIIPRLLGEDKEGILVIGQTTQMNIRRQGFISGSHSEGILWDKLERYTALQRKFPDYALGYCYSIMENEEQAKELEKEFILRYIIQYGEAPPLNSAIPYRYNHKKWRDLSQNC